MPRGFRVDHMQTALARLDSERGEFPLLKDPRSFVSQPKVTNHTGGLALPHLLLKGVDKGAMRAEIFRLDREKHHLAGMDVNRCFNCGVRVLEHGDWRIGQWHHIYSSPGSRCDCIENAAVSCARCHKVQHPQVEWSKSA